MVVGVPAGNGRVPSALPPILKNYTKSAIRTQPTDLIVWSYAYFQALKNGESPPVKEQIEFPLPSSESGVTPGLVRVLQKKFGSMKLVPQQQFHDLCYALGVKEWAVTGAWNTAEGGNEGADWNKLLVGLISQEVKTPQEKLATVMESVTKDPVSKVVPLDTVLKYLELVCNPYEDREENALYKETVEYLTDVASYQGGNLIPSDLSRPSFPMNQDSA